MPLRAAAGMASGPSQRAHSFVDRRAQDIGGKLASGSGAQAAGGHGTWKLQSPPKPPKGSKSPKKHSKPASVVDVYEVVQLLDEAPDDVSTLNAAMETTHTCAGQLFADGLWMPPGPLEPGTRVAVAGLGTGTYLAHQTKRLRRKAAHLVAFDGMETALLLPGPTRLPGGVRPVAGSRSADLWCARTRTPPMSSLAAPSHYDMQHEVSWPGRTEPPGLGPQDTLPGRVVGGARAGLRARVGRGPARPRPPGRRHLLGACAEQ